jgi:hypothetical protein
MQVFEHAVVSRIRSEKIVARIGRDLPRRVQSARSAAGANSDEVRLSDNLVSSRVARTRLAAGAI